MNVETQRLSEARNSDVPWRKWGPYLSERQWGTVREDYSASGAAWSSFPHDHARSRAYRWGEDGLGGICDEQQRLCFALALWNGKDPILKERLFGLTNSEGNHGEDVKEYYFYLDSTPTHSYMKYLYKYPQAEFPYRDLINKNRRRGRKEFEYELLDTGVFDDDRYFDVFVEYAKHSTEDILIQITVHNRGAQSAVLHLLPTLWFRNTWSCGEADARPILREALSDRVIHAKHESLGELYLHSERNVPILFTENETNTEKLYGRANATRYVKDGINDAVVSGRLKEVNPGKIGTKAALHFVAQIGGGEQYVVRLRLTDIGPAELSQRHSEGGFGRRFSETLELRRKEAQEFYAALTPPGMGASTAQVMHQAFAGMLWGKQYYCFDVDRWLDEHGSHPHRINHSPAPRNGAWYHMRNADVISMPDKWEYPWYAAWDLAFHVVSLAQVDPDFAKSQLELILHDRYLHPNGQIPAYEWNFSDVNPPVHAWAAAFTYWMEELQKGQGDVLWLSRVFDKLLINFTWWVNRKDREGRNVFEGGFLGLDNISIFDRSAPLPTGGHLEQSDGTAWMAFYCQSMTDIALELSRYDRSRGDMVLKFLEHFLWIASSMVRRGGMWDEEDGFFYDTLRLPDGRAVPLKVRSLVGLLPLCAVTTFDFGRAAHLPQVVERFGRFVDSRPELLSQLHDLRTLGHAKRRMLAIVDESRLRRLLHVMLDENEFLGPFGIRSLSRYHATHPYVVRIGEEEYRVDYLPAESDSGMFGGNSNWRGPVWMPINALIVRALLQYYRYYGDAFLIECPTGSGQHMTLYQVAEELTRRLNATFVRGADNRRPVYGGTEKFQDDPHWRDYILFYEYFHGENGAGLGASHQTGWTGVIAPLVRLFSLISAEKVLQPRDLLAGSAIGNLHPPTAAGPAPNAAARTGSSASGSARRS